MKMRNHWRWNYPFQGQGGKDDTAKDPLAFPAPVSDKVTNQVQSPTQEHREEQKERTAKLSSKKTIPIPSQRQKQRQA